MTFKDNIVNRIFDFRCSIYKQSNKIEIEVHISAPIFLLNRIITPLVS